MALRKVSIHEIEVRYLTQRPENTLLRKNKHLPYLNSHAEMAPLIIRTSGLGNRWASMWLDGALRAAQAHRSF